MELNGISVWAMLLAGLIAAIGLNINSSLVIMGAMLIAPVFWPVLGMGFAMGTNDIGLLKEAAKNLLTVMVIVVTASFLYFFITPSGEPSSELLARIHPGIYEVLLAVVGGVLGTLMVNSRRDLPHLVFGISISTALLPQLCTVGYGLAIFNLQFIVGALYLFFINVLFIALSATLLLRYFRYPQKEMLDKKQEKRVRIIIGSLVFISLIPTVITAWMVVNEAIFVRRANKFVAEHFTLEKTQYLKPIKTTYRMDSSAIEVFLIGHHLDEDVINSFKTKMQKHGLGKRTALVVRQSDGSGLGEFGSTLSSNMNRVLEGKDSYIKKLEAEIKSLKASTPAIYLKPLGQISQKVAAFYPEISEVGFSEIIKTRINGGKTITDTIPTAIIRWGDGALPDEYRRRLQNALKLEFGLDTMVVLGY